MATNIWNHKKQEHEEEDDEEEALSLSDLPINLEDQPRNQENSRPNNTTQEEFDFRTWGAPFSKEPQMCVADEVFFKGQILPLRVSFSSEAGLLASATGSQQHHGKKFINELSRLEPLDLPSNSSSRSSSLRSQNSSSSTSSTTTNTTPTRTKPRIRNQFHTHPSPKPQLRAQTPTQLSSFSNQGRKSTSAWGIFRLGVVPAPEIIGLQELKVRSTNNANRNCVSRNSSSSSSNSAKGVKTSNKSNSNNNNNVLKQLVGKGGGLLSGCDCSFETVQPTNMMMIKSGSNSKGGGAKSTNRTESTTTHAVKEKVVELKKQKHKQKQGKKVTSRRRTFEWIKELHATNPDEQALLSNSS